ncbi:MAG: macro domain-containing protein [Bacteriovoracales bacterium]
MNTLVKIIIGDITKEKIECIVSGTDTKLSEGGTVHDAILRAAGPKLKRDLDEMGTAKIGECKLTDGYHLPAQKIIHTVLPSWINGESNEGEDLTFCYKNTLEFAKINKIKELAFPVLGTGKYRFPKEVSVKIALQSIRRLTKQLEGLTEIHLIAFDQETFDLFKKYF